MHDLSQLDARQISTLMGVSDKIGKLNHARNQGWHQEYARDPSAKPAIYLFDGDAYKGLDAYTLFAKQIQYLNAHLGILSGLYGLLRPLDLILPYRLEMGTRFECDGYDNLYDFWCKPLTDLVIKRMQETDSNTLVNVASNEYFGALDQAQLVSAGIRIITPRFEDQKNGVYKVISFYAKKARGMMVRFCAEHAIRDAQALKDFDMRGYRYHGEGSDADTWIFRRDADVH